MCSSTILGELEEHEALKLIGRGADPEEAAERFRNPSQSIDQGLDDLINRYGFTHAVQMIYEA